MRASTSESRVQNSASEHLVQCYDSDERLYESIAAFIGAGLGAGEGGITIASGAHLDAIEARLSSHGLDVPALRARGRYVALDAGETLDRFMVNGVPDERLFNDVVGGLVARMAGEGRGVRAYGEMVAILWASVNRTAALRLEGFWNTLAEEHCFSLLCAYPLHEASPAGAVSDGADLDGIRAGHSRVISSNGGATQVMEGGRTRTIALGGGRGTLRAAEVVERARVENELRRSEHRMRQLMSLLPAAVYTCDGAGRVTFFNRRAAQLWGREPQLNEERQKFCGSLRLRRLDGTLLPHADSPMAVAVRLGQPTRNGEVVIERPDSSRVIVGVNIDPLRDAEGNLWGAINVFEDITERKQMEDALRQSQEAEAARRAELETLMEAVPAMVLIAHDPECRRITGNRFGHEVLGVPEGRNLSLTAPPDERPRKYVLFRNGEPLPHHELPIQKAARTGRPVRGAELESRLDDGTSRWLYGAAAPLLDPSRKVRGVIATFVDITTRKRAEQELQEAKEELSRANEELEERVQRRTRSLREAISQMEEFSYSVSHDLRAPVRAMHGYAQVLIEDYGDRLDDNGREYLDRIVRGGARMDRLIQDILTYSRLPRRDVQLQPVSLGPLVREVITHYPSVQPPHADVLVKGSLESVLGHEPLLVQCVSNLLSNAVKFVEPGVTPRVRIWTEPRGGAVRLWIEDNGVGIKPESQHRIFGLFERIHPESRYEGTGIGLAIVRKAVDRMGGRVGFLSDGLTGSSFWIELPAGGSS